MSKWSKIVYSILAVSLLPLLIFVIISTKPYISAVKDFDWLPVVNLGQKGMASWMADYLFWLALIVGLLLILFILVMLFYPRQYTQVSLSDDKKGTLLLKKSALDGFVKSLLAQEKVFEQAQVKNRLYKKKVDITVLGSLGQRQDVPEKLAQLQEKLETGLTAFFGLSQAVKFRVKVQEISPKETKTPRKRVE